MLTQTKPDHATADQVGQQANGFLVTAIRGGDNVQRALHELRDEVRPLTTFQSLTWLAKTYDHLVPAFSGVAHLVVVRRAHDGVVMMVLPLAAVHEHGHCVAGFPDFGLSDYGAPLVSVDKSVKWTADEIKALWKLIASALTGVDRLSLTNMPISVSSISNPLAMMNSATQATHARHVVDVHSTVEAFLASRGKKYRKEVERCYRLLGDQGDWHFNRAKTPADIATAFGDLERLQQGRWQDKGDDYALHRDAVSRFYSEALLAGDDKQGAQIFTLRSGDKTIAALYVSVFENTVTLLRIASEDGDWRRLSPGRLIVMEAMRHFVSHQITYFDLGIGDYAFKRGLGAEALPLVDVEQALGWKAWPYVVLMQAKGWLRRYPRMFEVLKAARQKMSR